MTNRSYLFARCVTLIPYDYDTTYEKLGVRECTVCPKTRNAFLNWLILSNCMVQFLLLYLSFDTSVPRPCSYSVRCKTLLFFNLFECTARFSPISNDPLLLVANFILSSFRSSNFVIPFVYLSLVVCL